MPRLGIRILLPILRGNLVLLIPIEIAMSHKPSPLPRHSPERSGPGRPREFEIEDALRDAINVFRVRGYYGTSIQNLIVGTGLGRGSLYRAFHDKRGLFLAVLQYSIQGLSQRISERLASAVPARTAIRKALADAAQPPASEEDWQGSLIAAAVSELMPGDKEVGMLVTTAFKRLERLFESSVRRGQAAGEIPANHDARALAGHLHSALQGMLILSRAGYSAQEIADTIEQILRALD